MAKMKWLTRPNLPEGTAALCAVSGQGEFAVRFLRERGIEVLKISSSPILHAPCASHPDMRMCYLGEGRILADGDELARLLRERGLGASVPGRRPQGVYPGDAGLNVLLLGKKLFCRTGSPKGPGAAEEILQFAEERGMSVHSVRQGYTRCSVCVVSENAVITADPSIGMAAERVGLDVLEIQPGHISLPGYEYGFIGGCTGLLGPGMLGICGSLETHPDGGRMADFVRAHGARILTIPTPDGSLWDIGGIVPLAESC